MALHFPAPLASRRIFSATAFSLFGPLIWALHLALVYGVHHVACRTGGSETTIAGFILAATVAASLVLVAAALRPAWLATLLRAPPGDDPLRPFLDAVMRWLVVLSVAGIVWAGAATGFIGACN